MSRTFRNKNMVSDRDFSKMYVNGIGYRSITETERMRLLHREYGDRNPGWRHAPSSFRKSLNATLKAKNKMILFNEVNYGKDIGYYPHIKDADWNYW